MLIDIEKIFIYLEKKYFPNFLYKIIIANAYLIGHLMSNNKKNDKLFMDGINNIYV